ncbi:MAG: PD-(D/E)XK nuclease family transposase [Alcaligenaceae bacterium]|nr:PD-(D/E)XK nuclease family transposase [Alcaligenaceae bacterium]
MIGKYLVPMTDFGFKKLLGEEIHSHFLKDLLNELLRDETGEIVEIKYLPNGQLPDTAKARRVIFDIYLLLLGIALIIRIQN